MLRTFTMNRHIFQHAAFLKDLYFAEPLERKLIIESMSGDQTDAISNITLLILQGRLVVNNLHKQKLKQYKQTMRCLANPRIGVIRKKRTMQAFHKPLPLLIKSVIHLIDEQ